MILRLSDSASRGLLVAAASLVGLWLSFFGIRAAIAHHDSEEETAKQLEAAVRLEPSNPDYWYILGRYQQYNLDQPDALLAENSYRKAIALNPDATGAWLDLAAAFSRAYRSNPNIDELLAQLLPPYPWVYVDVIKEALSEKQLAVARIVWARLLTLHPR